MDAKQQADGERRVREHLIEPLERRGLAKPATLTRDAFERMLSDLGGRLAYMSALDLAALEEVMAARPGGKDRDRFPIANVILEEAARIAPPPDTGSPLMRSVFAHSLGAAALEGGWAPELLHALRKQRQWPNTFVVSQIIERAGDAVRRMRQIEGRVAAGEALTPEERDWHDRRAAALAKCRELRALGMSADAEPEDAA